MRQRIFLAPAMPRNHVAVLIGEDVIAYGPADDPVNMEAVRVTDNADVYFSADIYQDFIEFQAADFVEFQAVEATRTRRLH